MTTLSSLPSTDLLAKMNPGSKSVSSTQEAQDRFMTLLVTQMKNQDPMNPLDNAQVTSQLAQLSTVTGIDNLNSTVKALMASTQATQSLQAASMIGHGVLVPGSGTTLTGGKALFGAELKEPVDSLQVTISDVAGNPVRTLDLGPQPVGSMALGWDGSTNTGGSAPDGQYQLQVSALRGGQKVAATSLSFGEVASISTSASGVQLNLRGSQTAATLADVRQIL